MRRDKPPGSAGEGGLVVGGHGERLYVEDLLAGLDERKRRVHSGLRQRAAPGELAPIPPQEAEVLALRRRVEFDEAHEQGDVGNPLQRRVERRIVGARAPQPVRLVVELEGHQ
jgi:hypothetical protein